MTHSDPLKPVLGLFLGLLLAASAFAPESATAQSDPTISIESQQADPGEAPNVPVKVTNFDNVDNFQVLIKIDDSNLTLPRDNNDLIEGAPRNFIVSGGPDPQGEDDGRPDDELFVAFFKGEDTDLDFGDGTLFEINFDNFAGGRAEIQIVDSETEVNGSSVDTNGGFVSETAGTVSLGSVSGAQLNETVSVPLSGQGFPNERNQGSSGPDVGQFQFEVEYPMQALNFEGVANNQTGVSDQDLFVDDQNGVVRIEGADANLDGNIDLNGTLLDLEFSFVGGSPLSLPFLEANSAVRNLQAQNLLVSYEAGSVEGEVPTVRLPDQAVTAGQEVAVPLAAEDLRDVGSASIEVGFNDGALSFKRAEDVIGSNFSVGLADAQTVRFDGFDTGGVDPSNNDDRLATLVFQVESGITTLGGETMLQFNGDKEVASSDGTQYNMTFEDGRLVVEDPEIGVQPTPVDFGTVTVGNSSTETLTITNEATEVAELSGTVQSLASGSPFTITSGQGSFTLDPQQSLDVTVEYAPSTASSGNQQTETLSITHNGANEPSPLDVALQGIANAPPAIGTASGVTVTVGGQVTVTDNELQTTDPEDGPSDLTYTVTTAPSQGQVLVGGSQSSTFTQADVDNGDVVYNHTASDATDDSFQFEVADSDGGTATGTFGITVEERRGVLSGTLTYPTEGSGTLDPGRPLAGVTVEARNSQTFSSATESNGAFSIEVEPGTYTVGPSLQSLRDDIGGAGQNVDINDALRVVLGSTGKDPFVDPFQRRVADVRGDGDANAIDALQIARFSIGEISSFDAGDWAATTQEASAEKGEETSGLGLNAAEYGDANFSGGETNGSGAKLSRSRAPSGPAGGEAQARVGKTVEVPVRLLKAAQVGAFQLTLSFEPEELSFEGASAPKGEALTSAGEGTVQVGWFDQSGTEPLSVGEDGKLVTLRFQANSETTGETALKLESGTVSDAQARPIGGTTLQLPKVGVVPERPDEFSLKDAAPNPARGATRLRMDLPQKAAVTVALYNTLGQQVRQVEKQLGAGSGQVVQINGSDLSSGQYFYRVQVEMGEKTIRETGRATIVR
jgi:hypothetical protein